VRFMAFNAKDRYINFFINRVGFNLPGRMPEGESFFGEQINGRYESFPHFKYCQW